MRPEELLLIGLPLLVAALIGLLLLLFVRRAASALARARDLARFGRDTTALADRLDALLSDVARRVDAVRRHQLPATELEEPLTGAITELETAIDEARAITIPQTLASTVQDLSTDVERALRALEMVLHGCRLAAGHEGRRGELEAQTSIKRGYLNLLHARETLVEHARRAARAGARAERALRMSRVTRS